VCVNIPRGEAGVSFGCIATRSRRKLEAGFDGDGGGGRGRIGCVLRNCRDYGTAALAQLLRGMSRNAERTRGRRKKRERKGGRIALDHFRHAERAPMSPGYVPRYTERSLSPKMHIPGRDAAPGHLTYKTIPVSQSSCNPQLRSAFN